MAQSNASLGVNGDGEWGQMHLRRGSHLSNVSGDDYKTLKIRIQDIR